MLRALSLTVGLLLLLAVPARAETVRLRSGKTLQVDAVRILEDRIQITQHRDGGTARIDLRFDRLDAAGLLALFDRHADAKDAATTLRTARLALARGLRAEAVRRFRQAAALDPKLGPERDKGLTTIRSLEAGEGFVELEMRMRAGADPHAAMAFAAALLDGPVAGGLSPAKRTRVRALGDLARRLFKRDQQRAARDLLAQAAAKPAANAPAGDTPAGQAPAAAGGALGAVRERVRAYTTKADVAREAAADPKLSTVRALRHLEAAATALQNGRRLLRNAPAALHADLAPQARAVLDALVATYLDLADLYRQRGRFDEARARVRVVLILDPGNEDAWAQRTLIEDDLRRDPVYDDGYGRGFETYYYSPSPFRHWGGSSSYRRGYARLGHHGHAHFGASYYGRHGGFTVRLGYGSHAHGHGQHRGGGRVVGTRR